MPAFSTQSDFMKLWTQSGQEAERKLQKFLLKGLDTIVQSGSDVLSKIKVGETIATPVVRWMEEIAYPTAVTAQWNGTTSLTFSGYLFNAAVSAESLRKVIRVGTILERQSDGLQLKVSSVSGIDDGAPYVATVGTYGNTTGSADSAAVTYEIISEVWSDYKDADETRSLDRYFREVGTQIHAETFEIPKTRKNTKYEIVGDEVEHQITALLEKMRRQIAYAVLRSRPYYSSGYKYGNATEESTMCGICTWPSIVQSEMANPAVYVNNGGAEITKEALDDLVRNMWLTEHSDFNTGTWYIICHPLVHKYIHDFDISFRQMEYTNKNVGVAVDTFDAKIGKRFPIISDRYMAPHQLIVADLSKMYYGYYQDDQLDRKELATQGRYQRWLISFQTYGVVVRKPRQSIGMIYNLAYS
jgi:hypothetical protein